MSSERYHDVMVVGSAPAGIMLAGLLARRGLNVALVGQQDPGPSFRHQQLELPAYCTWLPAPGSRPAVDRVLGELGLEDGVHQLGQRSPAALCLVADDLRLEFGADPAARARELRRTGLAEPNQVEASLEQLRSLAAGLSGLLADPRLLFPDGPWQRLQARRRWEKVTEPGGERLPPPLDWLPSALHFFANMLPASLAPAVQAYWLLALVEGLRCIPDMSRQLLEASRRAGCDVLDQAVAREVRPLGKNGVEVSFSADARPRRAALVVLAASPEQAQELLALGGGRRRLQSAAAAIRHVASGFVLDLVLPAEKLPLGLGQTCLLLPDGGASDSEETILLQRLPLAERQGREVVQLVGLLPTAQRYLGRKVLVEQQTRLLRRAGQVIPFLEDNLEFATSPFWQERASDLPHPDPWHLHPIYETDAELFAGCSPGIWWGPRHQVLLAGPATTPALGFEGAALQARHLADTIGRRLGRQA